ncbi:MAG TPA: ATP-dependent metallopeptidase FtsH/Yme1/Tma family protein, partial [Candidatus Binatia bacterium]|nr:ATP-dependent metallopeptidase FtsH/Yme1/Tma family protein [Candidatus Binatia bacterium]
MSRIPRSSIFYLILVGVLVVIFWFTWQSIENSNKGEGWTYSQVLTNAEQGKVKSVDIKGSTATVQDSSGNLHDVTLPENDNGFLIQQLAKDKVNIKADSSNGGTWLQVL